MLFNTCQYFVTHKESKYSANLKYNILDMDIKTKKQRSYNMSKIKAKNTKPEKKLFEMLDTMGITYEKHYQIVGKPDVVFPNQKIAVFVDGEFWHGKSFKKWKNNISEFWFKKISDNRKRDRKVNKALKNDGWSVIRIWGKDITKDSGKVKMKLMESLTSVNKG